MITRGDFSKLIHPGLREVFMATYGQGIGDVILIPHPGERLDRWTWCGHNFIPSVSGKLLIPHPSHSGAFGSAFHSMMMGWYDPFPLADNFNCPQDFDIAVYEWRGVNGDEWDSRTT